MAAREIETKFAQLVQLRSHLPQHHPREKAINFVADHGESAFAFARSRLHKILVIFLLQFPVESKQEISLDRTKELPKDGRIINPYWNTTDNGSGNITKTLCLHHIPLSLSYLHYKTNGRKLNSYI